LIAKLDCKTKEVLLDAKIVKVKLNTDITESVEWEGLFSILKTNGFTYLGSYPFSSVQAASDVWRSRDATFQAVGGVGSYPFSGTSTAYSASHPVTGLEGMHIGMVNKDQDFDAFIKAFKDIGETQIVSTPKITVVNNQEAKIHVGEKQAYVTTTTTTGQSTSTIAEDVTFVDVGTQLYVTPEINEQGFITLKVKSEISSVVSLLVTPSNNRIPIIDTSLAETTVMTKNGSSILIGGLRKDDKSLTETSVPILGSLPLVGKLFKSSMPKKGRTELLIMITPTIIEGDTLVDARGQVVGEEPIKKIKDYDMIKESPQLEPASVQPKAEQKINMIKGLKFRE
jgi:general secretion pathway protein D